MQARGHDAPLLVDLYWLSSPPSLESREPPRLSPGLARRLSSNALTKPRVAARGDQIGYKSRRYGIDDRAANSSGNRHGAGNPRGRSAGKRGEREFAADKVIARCRAGHPQARAPASPVCRADIGCPQTGSECPATGGCNPFEPAPAQVHAIQFVHAEAVPVRIRGNARIEEIFQSCLRHRGLLHPGGIAAQMKQQPYECEA